MVYIGESKTNKIKTKLSVGRKFNFNNKHNNILYWELRYVIGNIANMFNKQVLCGTTKFSGLEKTSVSEFNKRTHVNYMNQTQPPKIK